MSAPVRIELLPLGKTLLVARGVALQDVLFAQGVEFPCGGRGRCKGCRVRVLAGLWPPTSDERRLLRADELAAGWRLACRARASANLKLALAQWEAPILVDESAFAFAPQPGFGVAVDLGTTTVVAQLLDLATAGVLAVRMGLNAQAKHGADVMSRIDFALSDHGQATLQRLIREQVGKFIEELLLATAGRVAGLANVVIVGNAVMHHLFCGVGVEPLSHHPFAPSNNGLQVFRAAELGWELPGNPVVRFLPCLGGFVGSDILAGIVATRLHESESVCALVDLGTNGEIVIGNRDRILCASTAAGPAFEGARIALGMRAATGAISAVSVRDGGFHCRVIGSGPPRGICGSGLVDAVTAGLEIGLIHPSGRLLKGQSMVVCPPVALSQADIRQVQLAKGAIAAGIRLLLNQWGASRSKLARIYLAGAFGNYINRASAQRIGLLDFPLEKVNPAGNTALLGAKLALFSLGQHGGLYPEVLAKVTHVGLNEDPLFQEVYLSEMPFP
jgi:uncharacterized 2Fe-2S/4Fe-4S cluster protein (DUF4445 family)